MDNQEMHNESELLEKENKSEIESGTKVETESGNESGKVIDLVLEEEAGTEKKGRKRFSKKRVHRFKRKTDKPEKADPAETADSIVVADDLASDAGENVKTNIFFAFFRVLKGKLAAGKAKSRAQKALRKEKDAAKDAERAAKGTSRWKILLLKIGRKTVRILNKLSFVLVVLALAVACWMFFAVRWAVSNWGELSMSELLYQVQTLSGTGGDMMQSFIVRTILPAALIGFALAVVLILFRRKRIVHIPARIGAFLLAIILGITAVKTFWNEMDVDSYITSQKSYATFIDENYVDPNSVNLTFPSEKRNLIYIYLESMEMTFSDTSVGGDFTENVIPNLTALAQKNEDFSGSDDSVLDGGISLYNTNWTMAAMFAQTSGLPLSIPISNNDMSTQSTFFPGATVLGDILEDEGYNQYLLIGSDAVFGGRKLYFTEHGNYTMYDYNYSLENGEIPEDYFVWWGYEDEKLFENAKNHLTEIANSDEPFNFTMLTVDTHFPSGYPCRLCEDEFDNQYSNVYACSDRQVTEFIEWVQEQDWYENTTIVISGDHETMDSDYSALVDEDYQRKVYSTVINGAAQTETDTYREYSTFDLFPTTLAAMGVEIPGDRLGLGTNLYSSEQTLVEEYGVDGVNDGLASKSELMNNLIAGIQTEFSTISTGELDESSGKLTLKAENISWTDEMDDFCFTVTNDETGQQETYSAPDPTDGSATVVVDLQDFLYEPGSYSVEAIVTQGVRSGGKRYVSMGTASFTITEAQSRKIEKLYSGEPSVSMRIKPHEDDAGFNVSISTRFIGDDTLKCYIWSESDQSDMHVFYPIVGRDGNAQITIWPETFSNEPGVYSVHLYYEDEDGEETFVTADTWAINADEVDQTENAYNYGE